MKTLIKTGIIIHFYMANRKENCGRLLGSNTIRFVKENCPDRKNFIEFLHQPEVFPIVQFTLNFHKADKRKVTDDPYFKHLLYTAYLCFESPKFPEYTDSERRVFIASSLLHDASEMKRKNNQNFKPADLFTLIKNECLSLEEARRITIISSILTPQSKPKKPDKERWLDLKLTDFKKTITVSDNEILKKYQRVFPGNTISNETVVKMSEMIKEIKIADEAANLRETVDDVKHKKEYNGRQPNGIKSLDWRVEDFRNRLMLIRGLYPNHLLYKQLENDLFFLQDYLLLD